MYYFCRQKNIINQNQIIMKKFLIALLFIPIFVMGQKTINEATKDFEGKAFFDHDLYTHAVATYKYYYDEDDQKIMHGTCVIKGDDWWGLHKEIKLKTNGTATYTDGKLNGALTMSQTGTTPKSSASWSFKAAYTNGVPSGTWTYTETGITQNATMTASITWKDGKMSALKSETGVSITIDNDGNIVSGTVEGNSFKNGFLINKFIRKNGDWSQIESDQQALINSYMAGTITEDGLLDKGYIIKDYQSEIDKWFMSHLRTNYVYIQWFDPGFTFPDHPKYKVLRRIAFLSLEEILAYYHEGHSFYDEERYYSDVNFDKIARERNYDGKYMTAETIQQWKEFFRQKVKEVEEKKAEAAKQAEQQRIEMEEKRAERARLVEERKKAEQQEVTERVVKRAMNLLAALPNGDVKFWGADITIGVEYDKNPYAWSQYFTCYSDLRSKLGVKLKPFLPFDRYTIDNINGDECTCTIEKFISKKKSEFWKTTIKLKDGKIYLDESFDFSNAVKIETDQDGSK